MLMMTNHFYQHYNYNHDYNYNHNYNYNYNHDYNYNHNYKLQLPLLTYSCVDVSWCITGCPSRRQ
jgi:hypothetical protein